jgi:predicted DNA-binding transcriptional regulator AlpA
MNWDTKTSDRRIGKRELAQKGGFSHRSIQRFLKEKRGFPQPTKICGINKLTWSEGEVDAWIAGEVARNRKV